MIARCEASISRVGTVLETCAGMRSGAIATHFADAKRAHERASVPRAPAHYFNIGSAATELFQFPAPREDGIQVGGKHPRAA